VIDAEVQDDGEEVIPAALPNQSQKVEPGKVARQEIKPKPQEEAPPPPTRPQAERPSDRIQKSLDRMRERRQHGPSDAKETQEAPQTAPEPSETKTTTADTLRERDAVGDAGAPGTSTEAVTGDPGSATSDRGAQPAGGGAEDLGEEEKPRAETATSERRADEDQAGAGETQQADQTSGGAAKEADSKEAEPDSAEEKTAPSPKPQPTTKATGQLPELSTDEPERVTDDQKKLASKKLRKLFIHRGKEKNATNEQLRNWIKELWSVESTASLMVWQVERMIEALENL
jgi:hypothetical protein